MTIGVKCSQTLKNWYFCRKYVDFGVFIDLIHTHSEQTRRNARNHDFGHAIRSNTKRFQHVGRNTSSNETKRRRRKKETISSKTKEKELMHQIYYVQFGAFNADYSYRQIYILFILSFEAAATTLTHFPIFILHKHFFSVLVFPSKKEKKNNPICSDFILILFRLFPLFFAAYI